MGCSTPVLLVIHYLPEFAQTRVHWVSDAVYLYCLLINYGVKTMLKVSANKIFYSLYFKTATVTTKNANFKTNEKHVIFE